MTSPTLLTVVSVGSAFAGHLLRPSLIDWLRDHYSRRCTARGCARPGARPIYGSPDAHMGGRRDFCRRHRRHVRRYIKSATSPTA